MEYEGNDQNFKTVLKEIFPCRPERAIDEVIQIIQENSPDQEYNGMLEEMINLLMESGDSTLQNDEFLDEATGYSNRNPENYLIRASKEDSIFIQFSDMLPDADPDYLREKARILADQTESDMEVFIENALTKHDYPTKRDYFKKQKILNDLKVYTTNFTVEAFLEIIPDPMNYFYSSDYQPALTVGDVSDRDEKYAFEILIGCFPYLREKDIKKIFDKHKKNLMTASDFLARIPRFLKSPRKFVFPEYECENIQLLQELAFIRNKQQIKTAIKMKNELYRIARAEAEKYGLLETCQCCFFEGLLPEESYFCKKNCIFCKDCVAKGAEHVVGKGELVFPCLSNCKSEFGVATLQMVLDKKIFEPLFAKIQVEELKKANIDGLETCPFCDFSMILAEYEKVFKCQNVECMEESCRECRQKSHLPLKCNEIEYDEDVKRRTYIENKMTEALVRTCWKCQKSFLKESGCNKMTCVCGAKMCYVCGATDISYSHFGEISNSKCPLYTQNLKEFHAQRVITSAYRAKQDLGADKNPTLLKKDPTEGLEAYFNGSST